MAAQVEIEDQQQQASVSVTELDNGEIFDPLFSDDADSSSSSTTDSMILLGEGNKEHDVITACFLSGFGGTTVAKVVSVRKRSSEGITTRAKHLSFRIFTEAVARKNGGDPNVKYGWYAASSREEAERIVSYGFTNSEVDKFQNDDVSHGVGIHLFPSKCSLFAAEAAEADEEGLRHLVLCRLILGKVEKVNSGSKQLHPSSVEFDSGVDDLQSPRKYVVWSCAMNSYILPSYIVSFRSPRLRVISRGVVSPARPSSPWVSFASLMLMLSKSMDASRMNLIMRAYHDFRKRKIQRDQLVRKMREVAGDDLLAQIIKNHRDKNKVKV